MAQRDLRQLGLADSIVRRRDKKSEWLDRLDGSLVGAEDMLRRDPELAYDEPDIVALVERSRDAKRAAERRRRLLLGAAFTSAVVFAAVAIFAWGQWTRAQQQTLPFSASGRPSTRPGGEPGSEDFYADHVAHGRLYDRARRLVSNRATPGILNAHKGEPGAVPVQDSSRLAAHVTLWLGSA